MQERAFHFEVRDVINQFIAAFDDVVIGRYNKQREELAQIKVRYVYAPKERVLFDIVNQAQNITLPVVAITPTSITRDESRVFNKIAGFDVPRYRTDSDPYRLMTHVRMPVPVNITVSMSIIASYQYDLDQIISNFAAYCNPYIIISWKLPMDFGFANVNEIRSEVLWDGNISLKYPTEVTASEKMRFEADTSFVIKGWLFPAADTDPIKTIYFINSNFHVNDTVNSERFAGFDTYYTLSGSTVRTELSAMDVSLTDVISVSAAPSITNLFFISAGDMSEIYSTLNINSNTIGNKITLVGKRFQYTKNVLLSSGVSNFYTNLTSIGFEHYPTISAYMLPTSSFQIINENLMTVSLPKTIQTGVFDIIVQNTAGWDSLIRNNNIKIQYS